MTHVPVVTTSPARSGSPRSARSLAIHARAIRGSPRTFAPEPVDASAPFDPERHRMGGEVDSAPRVGGGRPEDEELGTGEVRDELRRSRAREVVEARVGDLDRDVQRVDRVHHLVDGAGRTAGREIAPEAKRELRLRDRHVEVAGRDAIPVAIRLDLEEPAGEGSVDPDVGLAPPGSSPRSSSRSSRSRSSRAAARWTA